MVLTGGFDQSTGLVLLPVLSCTPIFPGFALTAAVVARLDTGAGSVVLSTDTTAPFDCMGGTPALGPLALTPLPQTHDEDADGCTDWEELGANARRGGQRDPFNPYDFYDVSGRNGQPDGQIDILDQAQVAFRVGATQGDIRYAAQFDRGARVGPSEWNRNGPDGTINMLDDMLAVRAQYGHSCTAAP